MEINNNIPFVETVTEKDKRLYILYSGSTKRKLVCVFSDKGWSNEQPLQV